MTETHEGLVVADVSVDTLIALLADAAAGKRVAELVQVGVELGRRLERAGLGRWSTEDTGYVEAPSLRATRTRRTRPIRCPVCESTALDAEGDLQHGPGCTSDPADAPRPGYGPRRAQVDYQPRFAGRGAAPSGGRAGL